MPKRRKSQMLDPLIYERLCGERLFDPLNDKEARMGRHFDEDGNGIADAAEHVGELPHDDGVELADQTYLVIDPDQFPEA